MLHRVMLPHVTYIGVTGSCAKTTTTRLIGTVLEAAGRVRTKERQWDFQRLAQCLVGGVSDPILCLGNRR